MAIVADKTTPCDPCDEAAFPPVPYDSAEWDEFDDHWVSRDATRVYTRRFEFRFFEIADPWDADADAPLPDAPDFAATQTPNYWSDLASAGVDRMPAVSGGCDDDIPVMEHYEPTAADLAEYGRWSDELERLNQARDWYDRHPLAEFNADRVD